MKSKIKLKQGRLSKKSGYKKAIVTLKGQVLTWQLELKMGLKTFKPYTKSTRGTVIINKSNLWKGSPYKPLTKVKSLQEVEIITEE